MRDINSIFRTKKIIGFLADLISDQGHKNINDLSEKELQQFASLLIEASGRNGETEFLTEHAFSDVLIDKVKEALFYESKTTDETLLFYIKSHAVEYYNDTMKALFDTVYENYESEVQEWSEKVRRFGYPDNDSYIQLEKTA